MPPTSGIGHSISRFRAQQDIPFLAAEASFKSVGKPRRMASLLTVWLCLLYLPGARCSASSQGPSVTQPEGSSHRLEASLTLLAGIQLYLTASSLAFSWGSGRGGKSFRRTLPQSPVQIYKPPAQGSHLLHPWVSVSLPL